MRPCKVLARGYFDSSMTSSTLLTPRQAADKIGISYPAFKHWSLAGRIRTVKTPGGHHRVPVEALNEFLPGSARPAKSHSGSGRISGLLPLLQSATSDIGTNISHPLVVAMPRNTRNFVQLTDPRVVQFAIRISR